MSNSHRHAAITLHVGVIRVVNEAHKESPAQILEYKSLQLLGGFEVTVACQKRMPNRRSRSSQLIL